MSGYHEHARSCSCSPRVCESCGVLVCNDCLTEHDRLHERIAAIDATLERAEAAAIRGSAP